MLENLEELLQEISLDETPNQRSSFFERMMGRAPPPVWSHLPDINARLHTGSTSWVGNARSRCEISVAYIPEAFKTQALFLWAEFPTHQLVYVLSFFLGSSELQIKSTLFILMGRSFGPTKRISHQFCSFLTFSFFSIHLPYGEVVPV